MAVSQDMPQPSTTKISLKITFLKFYSNLSGVNELTQKSPIIMKVSTDLLCDMSDISVNMADVHHNFIIKSTILYQ